MLTTADRDDSTQVVGLVVSGPGQTDGSVAPKKVKGPIWARILPTSRWESCGRTRPERTSRGPI